VLNFIRQLAQHGMPTRNAIYHGTVTRLLPVIMTALVASLGFVPMAVATGEFGPVPLGGMTYWSGVWPTALLLVALAITPVRWRRLVLGRRMIGVTALVYSVANIFIYFALRFSNFASIAQETVTRLSLILASAATA
jgi:DMSO/TMAO reductase YedYZ heme-binding membrane subunit